MKNTVGTTVTEKEFNCIQCDVMTKFCNEVWDLQRRNKYGMELKKGQFNKIKELYLYMISLWTRKQDKFEYLPYSNYINNYMVRAIFNNAKELL